MFLVVLRDGTLRNRCKLRNEDGFDEHHAPRTPCANYRILSWPAPRCRAFEDSSNASVYGRKATCNSRVGLVARREQP